MSSINSNYSANQYKITKDLVNLAKKNKASLSRVLDVYNKISNNLYLGYFEEDINAKIYKPELDEESLLMTKLCFNTGKN